MAIIPIALADPRPVTTIAPDELAKVQAAEASRVRIVEGCYPTVVAIFGMSRAGGGSGVLFSPEGYVLTNFHVSRGAGGPVGLAGLSDGRLYPWRVIGEDPGGDLAIIQLLPDKDGNPRDGKFHAAPLGNSNLVRVGDWAMAMGNPFLLAEDYTPTVTLGVVSGIERYQPGEGGTNMLVYGNCIQIDSSINPGNSGGPLFNLAGQVIGINGRGSFEERGRVNVGVGYAISAEQIKNFIPELLSTKICQHGTLDAIFRQSDHGVICSQLDLDGIMAHQGMELSDRLIAFDGKRITSANQFTNLISTLPAGWPVEVVWEHDGANRSVWVRLSAVPYNIPKQPMNPDGPGPRGRPPGPPGTQPAPLRIRPNPGPPQPEMKPGEVRDKKLNREEAERIVRLWRWYRMPAGGGGETVAGFAIDEDVVVNGTKVGHLTTTKHVDSRFRADFAPDADNAPASGDFSKQTTTGWDDTYCYKVVKGEDPIAQKGTEATRTQLVQQALTLAAAGSEKGLSGFRAVELQGADKTWNQRAYRVFANDPIRGRFVLWFSLLGDKGQFETRLLKIAPADERGREAELAVTFDDYRDVGGVMVPFKRRIVRGIAEHVVAEYTATSIKPLKEIPDDAFTSPVPLPEKETAPAMTQPTDAATTKPSPVDSRSSTMRPGRGMVGGLMDGEGHKPFANRPDAPLSRGGDDLFATPPPVPTTQPTVSATSHPSAIAVAPRQAQQIEQLRVWKAQLEELEIKLDDHRIASGWSGGRPDPELRRLVIQIRNLNDRILDLEVELDDTAPQPAASTQPATRPSAASTTTRPILAATTRPIAEETVLDPVAAQEMARAGNIFENAIDFANRRTVKILGAGAGTEHGYGTGLLVSRDGLILSAHGVYTASTRIRIVLADGRMYNAEVIRRNEPLQAVLLKIEATTPEFFDLSEPVTAQKGDWVVAVANPFKVAEGTEKMSVNLGVVSLRAHVDAKKRTQDVPLDCDVLVIDAITSNPGAPGGALMTPDGKLAGMIGKILESKSTNTRLNYAVPTDLLKLFIEGKEIPGTTAVAETDHKPWIGLRVFKEAGTRAPAYIDNVVPGSPADKAGLAKDDLIVSMGGEIIRHYKDYEDAAAKLTPGSEVVIVVKRGNDIVSAKVPVLDGRPSEEAGATTQP